MHNLRGPWSYCK